MPFVTSKDGVKLHYELHDFTDPWAKAPLLILQHGFGRSSRYWFSMIPYLSRFYRVACPDLRGLGKSSKPGDLAKGITIDAYLGDILTIADELGAETFHYAGESLGGMIGYVLAARHADRVRTLGLLSASLTVRADSLDTFKQGFPTWQDALRARGPKAWGEGMNTDFRFPPGTDPDLMEWYADQLGHSDVEVLIAMSGVAPAIDVEPLLPKIEAPVLGMYPAQGGFVTSGQEAILRRHVRNLRLIHLPGKFHTIWMVAPATCATAMLHFMAAHDGIVCQE